MQNIQIVAGRCAQYSNPPNHCTPDPVDEEKLTSPRNPLLPAHRSVWRPTSRRPRSPSRRLADRRRPAVFGTPAPPASYGHCPRHSPAPRIDSGALTPSPYPDSQASAPRGAGDGQLRRVRAGGAAAEAAAGAHRTRARPPRPLPPAPARPVGARAPMLLSPGRRTRSELRSRSVDILPLPGGLALRVRGSIPSSGSGCRCGSAVSSGVSI